MLLCAYSHKWLRIHSSNTTEYVTISNVNESLNIAQLPLKDDKEAVRNIYQGYWLESSMVAKQ